MTISPLDVRNQIFRRKLRGFDPDEVRHFLEAVADCMEEMLKEKEQLERENSVLHEKADVFTQMETALRETMVTAQKISDEAKVNAQKEADNILRQAELDARSRVEDASRRVDDIKRMQGDAKARTSAFITKLRSLLEGHLSFLGSIESEVRSEDPPQPRGTEVHEDVHSDVHS